MFLNTNYRRKILLKQPLVNLPLVVSKLGLLVKTVLLFNTYLQHYILKIMLCHCRFFFYILKIGFTYNCFYYHHQCVNNNNFSLNYDITRTLLKSI